jgi:ERCC4-type nuclease
MGEPLMIVDTRAGSELLIGPLGELGVLVTPGILPAGDVEIVGNGPEGRPVLVGVEHKTVEDAVACMRNGRFAEQARGMAAYYAVRWVCVEGEITVGNTGLISVRRGLKWFELPGKVRYQEFAGWLLTMTQSAGMLLQRTKDKHESAMWLRSLELWWTAKEWGEHRAHLEWYQPEVVGNPFEEPSLAKRVAATLPHIGAVKAERVATHFKSMRGMAVATVQQWMEVKGVGKRMAAKIVKAIEEEK